MFNVSARIGQLGRKDITNLREIGVNQLFHYLTIGKGITTW